MSYEIACPVCAANVLTYDMSQEEADRKICLHDAPAGARCTASGKLLDEVFAYDFEGTKINRQQAIRYVGIALGFNVSRRHTIDTVKGMERDAQWKEHAFIIADSGNNLGTLTITAN